MEGYSRKEEGCPQPQLLDLIPRDRKWVEKRAAEEEKLELSLGPPGGCWSSNTSRERDCHGQFPCVQNSPWKESANEALPTAQKRAVGWPPICSFRKSIASGQKVSWSKPAETYRRSLFVKVNMDGIPIVRKVNLKDYDNYEKLSRAVDQLFKEILAAQTEKEVDGRGEYALVYEDNEGDRVLVGDVPWHMFLLTVKRLHVLKTLDLPKLSSEVPVSHPLNRCEAPVSNALLPNLRDES